VGFNTFILVCLGTGVPRKKKKKKKKNCNARRTTYTSGHVALLGGARFVVIFMAIPW
jgi:hypothetical protein